MIWSHLVLQQDYKYCKSLIKYFVLRGIKVLDSADKLEEESHNIGLAYDYTQMVLEHCTGVLEIPKTDIDKTDTNPAVKSYTEFETTAAEKEDWITSMIVLIPCYQVTITQALQFRSLM